jgi:hypothetical protein
MGFPGYFLVVGDFIRWAKDQGIRVGPGRGSAAGSVVAYGKLSGSASLLPFKIDTSARQLPGGHLLNAAAAAGSPDHPADRTVHTQARLPVPLHLRL